MLLVMYLALRGGGYDEVVLGEGAALVWWLIGVGLVFGLLPERGPGRWGWALIAVLGALAIWTSLGLIWSDSAERTLTEVIRALALLGTAVLLLLLRGRRPAPLLAAVGAAGALIALIALLSRFQPGLFPGDAEVAEILPTTVARLSFPLDYWNALALLVAATVPPLIALSTATRSRIGSAAAAAVVPAMILAAFYTLSRTGLAAIAIAGVVTVLLYPRRVELAVTLTPVALGTAVLIWAADRRDSLADGLDTAVARAQGDAMMLITLGVLVAVGLSRYALKVLEQRDLVPRPTVARATASAVGGGLAIGLAIAAIAAGAPGEVSDRWEEFKDPTFAGEGTARLASAGGRGRYQWWQAAVEAGQEEPVHGIGPGNYEYYWNQHGTLDSTIRDAHSLYLEAFAELGIPGLLLVLALAGGVLVGGTAISLRAPTQERALLTGAVAGCAAFAVGAAVDWSWENTLLPIVFVILAATIARSAPDHDAHPPRALPIPGRAIAGVGIAAAIVAIMLPTAAADSVETSEERFDDGDLQGALESSERAEALAPWAASPLLQQALVLEEAGDLAPAAEAARAATRKEELNWQTWLILARIEAGRERTGPASSALARARELNPRSVLFRDLGE